ncbi:MAG: PRC-barrel domain-containing protein [Candidatus Woesearchaeota archaeon]
MPEEEKKYSRQLIGKVVVTKSGKKLGEVGNLAFEVRTGELINVVLKGMTSYVDNLDLEKDKTGQLLVPYSAVIAVGDFVVVAEEDIV